MLFLSVLAIAAQAGGDFDAGPDPLLMQHPTINATTIVFQFAGDLWSVPRAGGQAQRLTNSPGQEIMPKFSPDGKTIAFTGEYDGNADVYTMPITGGVPKRITYHPGADLVANWTPDGKSILFASGMMSANDCPRLFSVSKDGGIPTALPFPMGSMGSLSPDGQRIAYVPGIKWQEAWKRYRGGQAYAIWIGRLSDSKVVEIPRKNWNDSDPAWVGDKVYFLDDQSGPVGMSSYDVNTQKITKVVPGEGFDLKSLSAGPGAIVYEQLGSIHLFDLATQKETRVPIEIHGDFPEVRPEFKNVASAIDGVNISPSGQRLVATARGWAFTLPASKGDARLLGEEQGVFRREPAWSPDGRTISYITDQNGRQQMDLVDAQKGTERLVDLGDSPAYYYAAGAHCWSPDSRKIAYTDNRNQLWTLDVASGTNTKIDQTIFSDPTTSLAVSWSPDSKWLTWARDLPSHMQAIFVQNLETGKKTQITDGMAGARSPIFDRDGKHLYFYATTNLGPAVSWLDMSSYTNPQVYSAVYCVVLRKDLPNPLQPESDEETVKDDAKPAAPPTPPAPAAFNIDVDQIENRIITLPIPGGEYQALEPGTPGTFFTFAAPPTLSQFAPPTMLNVGKFSMADRKLTPFGQSRQFITTPDGSKALTVGVGGISIVSTMAPTPPGTGAVDVSGLSVKIDPHQEWTSIFNRIWDNEPIFLYADNLNGINAEAMRRRYAPFVKNVCSRADLNYLFTDMLGEVSIGHMWAQGGDIPTVKSVPGGLLGIDFKFSEGHYQITRIYDGERWNPGLYAPMAQPGINAKVGEYILAIDGKDLKDSNDIYEMLEQKAGKQVKVTLSPTTSTVDSRDVIVVPIASDHNLRNRAWAEDNRRYVEKMTNGRAGYVHVPDTNIGGWTSFIRYYYAQLDHDGMVVDERFNHGGLINDYMIYEMTKTMDGAFTPRNGKDWPTPGNAIFGPKVMLINQFSGSGGDMFPWLFRHKKIGPLIGKRTWGGLIAAFSFPTVDGGSINAPDDAFYNIYDNKWDVEGHGVDPDIDVDLDPYLWRQGHDSQLDKAIETINASLAKYKRPDLKRPPNPDRTKVDVRY